MNLIKWYKLLYTIIRVYAIVKTSQCKVTLLIGNFKNGWRCKHFKNSVWFNKNCVIIINKSKYQSQT